MIGQKIFELTNENFSEVTEKIHDELLKTNANKKEVNRADLLIEETFMRLVDNGNAMTAKIKILRRFGDVSIKMETDGDECVIPLLKSPTLTKKTKIISVR